MENPTSPQTTGPAKSAEGFKFRISTRLILGLALLILMILSVSVAVIWFKGRPLLREISEQSQTQIGQNVALALEQELALVAGITRSMAELGASLPNTPELMKQSIPKVLNQLGKDSLIAGGGIWPEPHKYQQGVVRNSFFWGRDANGELLFYSDYNHPEGPGYHNEEWYVPARLLSPGQIYWSKSYTDPYSLQPMVTCTAPMFRDGEFVGVATVDLKLDGVSRILDNRVNTLDAYAFVVDRNNKFIAYPHPDRVMTLRREKGATTPDFIHVRELANIQPSYRPVAENLAELDQRLFGQFSAKTSDYMLNVDLLTNSSYQIEASEARRIAAHLWNLGNQQELYPRQVDRYTLNTDSLLFDEVSVLVYQLPAANWKVVTVFRRASSLALTDQVAQQLMFFISLTTVLFGLIAYALLRAQILQPIRNMILQLSGSVSSEKRKPLTLDYGRSDELGMLAFWFDQRSKQLEYALEKAEKANLAKTAFLAKMSHEFRTPLNSIIGFSRRLAEKLENQLSEFQIEALRRIHRNGHHLQELVNDILDLTAIEAGDIQLRLARHSVNDIVTEAVSEASMLIEQKDVHISFMPLEEDMKLECDRIKMLQILVNLLSNAIKATRRGTVQLEIMPIEGESERVCFQVTDTGVGISEFDQKKLFKKFSQVDNRLGAERGTGLGLFLVREFVRLHKGTISLQSELGVGTAVSVVLPLTQK